MLLEVVLSWLITVHLLSVNLAAAGPLVAIGHEWKEFRGDRAAGRAGRALLLIGLVGTFSGAALGLAAGWLLWDQGLAEAVRRVPSKIHFGIWELLFSLVLTTIQWLWWRRAPQAGMWQRLLRTFLALLASTNLLYHFPVLFAVLTEMIHRSDLTGVLNSAGFRSELLHGTAIPRSVHFLLAAIATCGVAVMLYGQLSRRILTADEQRTVIVGGARWATAATLLQIPVGLWLMAQVTPTAQMRLIAGADWIATSAFAAALLLALWLAHMMAAVALGEASGRLVFRSAVVLLLVVWLMSTASRRAFAPASSQVLERRAFFDQFLPTEVHLPIAAAVATLRR